MRTQGAFWMIVPPIRAQGFPIGIERIDKAVLGLAPFTHHEEADFGWGVVKESVRDPCSGRKANAIARLEPTETAIEPNVRLAVDYIDKLFLGAICVRK